MSQKISKRIRRHIKEDSPTLLSKKEFRKIEFPNKDAIKAHANWKVLYNEAKRVYRNFSQNEKVGAW